MYALIVMGLSLTFLVVLLRLRVKLGRAMVLSAFALAALLQVTPARIWATLLVEWQDKPVAQTTGYLFVTLTALVLLVNVLGQAMTLTGVSERLVPALQGLFRSRRVALAAIPLMMGMLPTPGGIMLSAPMVRDLGDKIGVKRHHLAAINFFFRHQWETIWPLFPAVPLIQGMFGVTAFVLISHNLPIMLLGLTGGVLFLLLTGIPPRNPQATAKNRFRDDLRNFVHATWPIALAAALYAAANIPCAIGILIGIIAFLLLHKVALRDWGTAFKAASEPDFVLLILGALLFKLVLEAGGAVGDVVAFLTRENIPYWFVIFAMPFLVAFLTGLTMPTVAITFPFLIAFIGTGAQTRMGLETLAFSGLICGLMVTPVHLCLALSVSYFDAPLGKIIVKLLPACLFILLAGALMALLS